MPVHLNERKIRILTGLLVGCILTCFITAILYGTYLVKKSKVYNEEFHFPIATNTIEVAKDWNT